MKMYNKLPSRFQNATCFFGAGAGGGLTGAGASGIFMWLSRSTTDTKSAFLACVAQAFLSPKTLTEVSSPRASA